MAPYPPMPFLLQTERLRLRSWTDADVEAYGELIAERGDGPPSPQTVREKIAAQHRQATEAGIALLATHRRREGDFVGYCGLTVGRATLDEPEIAYELLRRQQGQGYATEAARAVVDAAIATGRQRLWCTIRVWNAASLRVAAKLGFERDHNSFDARGELVWMTRRLRP